MNDTGFRRWWLTMLLAPSMAFADTAVTYHCAGTEQVTPGNVAASHVTHDYTLKFTEDGGRYWDWQEHRWYAIHSVDLHEIVLADETIGPALHGHWTASIDRQSGAWSAFWAGGQHTTSWNGRCKLVRYRAPPP
jgi:hypothetical protein